MKKNEYGRSMIEMLGVLAIIGILSVGGFDLISKANNNRKVAAVIDEIGSLARKSRTVMRDYEASDEDESIKNVSEHIKKGQAYPDNLEYTNDTFIGTDDVEYKIYYANNDSVLFILEASKLTTDMCMQIATIDWGSRSTNGFLGMDINVTDAASLVNILSAETVTPNNNTGIPGNSTHPVPMGIGTATDLCADDVTIHFAFR